MDLLKESDDIQAAEPVTEKGPSYPQIVVEFQFVLQKMFFQTHLVSGGDLGDRGPSQRLLKQLFQSSVRGQKLLGDSLKDLLPF